MTDELKHVSINGRITRAAPHPQGAQLNPREYYMVDRGGNDLGLLAYPGATHVIVYWLDTSSMTPRICYEVCETVRAAERALSEHSKEFSDLRPEGIVTQLEKTLEAARKLAAPKPESFQGMPYLGQTVWVIAPNGKAVPVRVTEIAEMSGEMCVIFGFHYKPNGQWFWTQEAAETYAADPAAQTGPKNVFLGEKS